MFGDARQDNEEQDGRDWNEDDEDSGVNGMGAEDAGPSAPTMVQQVAQTVQDATGLPAATQMAGVSPYVIYAGIAMVGYWVYSNYFSHES